MNLYDDRNKIIKLFEDNYITPSMYAHDVEPKEFYGVQESGEESEEKYRRKSKNEKTKT